MRSEAGTARVPPGPRRLHPLSMAFLLAGHARSLLPAVLVALTQARRAPWLLVLVAAMAGVMAAGTVLTWLRHTYELDPEEGVLRIDEGVLARKHRTVPLDRIQQVSLAQKLLHRLLGVARLRIETAGGAGGSEVDLDVIGLAEAERLRASLQAARGRRLAGAEPAAPPERTLVQLGPGQVALSGILRARAAAILALVASATQYADDLPGDPLERLVPARWEAPELGTWLVLGAVAAGVVVWLGLSAASSLLTDFGFTLVHTGTQLVARRGLLDRRESILLPHRVQVVWVSEPLLARLLGYATLRLQSAGDPGVQGRGAERVTIPLLPAGEVGRVVGEVLPGAAPLPALAAPPPAARRRAIVRHALPTALAALALTAGLWPAGAVALLAVPLAALLGELAYRGLGHALHGGYLLARRGWLWRRTAVVPASKVQSARVTSSPFQRRAGLATFHADVAGHGGAPRVIDEAAARARALLAALARAPSR